MRHLDMHGPFVIATMPTEFVSVHERVILNKYTEPVQSTDFLRMMVKLKTYAQQAARPILAIADLSEVKHFPSYMLTLALREGNINPVRNPKIETLLVIADSPLLVNVVSVIGRITDSRKIILVRTYEDAQKEIAAFVKRN